MNFYVSKLFFIKIISFSQVTERQHFSPYKALYFECYATMSMLANAHISSLGYLWEPLPLRGEQKKNEGRILVISESVFQPATMNFAVGFDLRLPHKLMEQMLRELRHLELFRSTLNLQSQSVHGKELLSLQGLGGCLLE